MITVVQGGQYGSEAKGAITAYLAMGNDNGPRVDYAVRTGSINAGHTFYYPSFDPKHKHVMQQLPCAWHVPGVQLVLGPGTYVHPATLTRELGHATALSGIDFAAPGAKTRLWIDRHAGIHRDSYMEEAREAGRAAMIGATGKGCAEAVLHKIADRNRPGAPSALYFDDPDAMTQCREDVPGLLAAADDAGQHIMLEGTQGHELDLHLGPYPFTTNRQTIAAAWVAEAGLSPARKIDVVLVARTYPIRVAGNSGPMPDEIDWVDLARIMNHRMRRMELPPVVEDHAVDRFEWALAEVRRELGIPANSPAEAGGKYLGSSNAWGAALLEWVTRAWALCEPAVQAELSKLFEVTTVTRRLRRISMLDRKALRRVVQIERPTYLALTFLNYVFPELNGQLAPTTGAGRGYPVLTVEHLLYLDQLGKDLNCPVGLVTIGPGPEHVIDLRRDPGVASFIAARRG